MSIVQLIKEVKVGINFAGDVSPVGLLAIRDRRIYFEYYQIFIKGVLEISTLRPPLKSGMQSFDYDLFEGFPDVFNYSMPDG